MILKSSRTDKNQGCCQLSKLRAPTEFGGWSGKRGFLCWWVAPSRRKPASQSHPARQKAVPFLGWLCLRHSVKPRDSLTHTHTHSQAWPCKHRKRSCSLGFTPANLACWAEIFRSEKCLPSQSLIIIAWCSLISLAISKSLYSTDLGVLERQRHLKLRNRTDSLFTCLLLLCCVLWLSPGQN